MKIKTLTIREESEVEYNTQSKEPLIQTIDRFFNPLHNYLSNQIDLNTQKYPHIDFDLVKVFLFDLLNTLPEPVITDIKNIGVMGKNISKDQWTNQREHRALMVFLQFNPEFSDLLTNIHLLSSIAILSAECHINSSINTQNFVTAKQFIDEINRHRWTRQQNKSEQQSGVSNLGQVSEGLLEKALHQLIDGRNFFKTNNQKVQSYGDFVLMCLPNNLWLSVKSNFARERLLASGYTTDILGVGFFTSSNEFTSPSKIRNFQRVGFLAMYLPEIPISEKQIIEQSNTYDEVITHYGSKDSLPVNINGTKFIRPLSALHGDLLTLLSETNIANRIACDF